MLEIIIDFDGSALRSLTQLLQNLRLKDVITVVSYLKGVLMLLQKCGELSTDTIGLLNGIICSVDCTEFGEFMRITYVNHERKTDIIEFMTHLDLEESEYRTL